MKQNIKTACITSLMMLSIMIAKAQVQPLKQGDTLPNITITALHNARINSLNTTNLRGKLLIIDFWSTWCSSCISGLAKMEKLQEKYKNDIVILPVTTEPKEIVSKFWKANHITKQLKLPTVYNDTIFKKLFPHVGVPHIVWIDKAGKFFSATRAEYANEKELEDLINGQRKNWAQNLSVKDYDFSNRLMHSNFSSDSAISGYSTFLPFRPEFRGASTNVSIDTVKKMIKITSINNTRFGLYMILFEKHPVLKYHKKETVNIRDTSTLRYFKSWGYRSDWERLNKFCYELIWPLDDSLSANKAYEKMRSDLDDFYGFKSTIDTIQAKQYILTKAVLTPSTPSKVGKEQIHPLTLTDFIDILNIDQRSLPLIINNHIHETDVVMIEYNPNQEINFSTLNQILAPKGFTLVEKVRSQPAFVLSDK